MCPEQEGAARRVPLLSAASCQPKPLSWADSEGILGTGDGQDLRHLKYLLLFAECHLWAGDFKLHPSQLNFRAALGFQDSHHSL